MIVVGLVTFAVALAALGARATYGARTTADEPQYLVTALSLGEDFDLDISDEIDNRQFLPFHEINLNQQTIELNETGQQLSPHDPLLPLLLAAPMRLGGWPLAKATLAAFAAVTAAATLWLTVERFGTSLGWSAMLVGGFFTAPPLTAYATQVYPEIPAALCVVAALIALTGDGARVRRRGWVVAVLAVIALPWLGIKYTPVAAVLALGLLWRLGWRPHAGRAAAMTTAVLAAAVVVYAVVHQRIYGGWTVYATGDHFVNGELLVVGYNPDYVGRSRRLIGLLVDREFGLVAWTPAFLLLLPAMVSTVLTRLRSWPLLLAAFAAGWATATWIAYTMHGWWWPGRQLVVVLPIAVVAITTYATSRRWAAIASLAGCALGTASWLWLVVEASTGRRTLIVDFPDTANPWYQVWSHLLPNHQTMQTGDIVLTTLWTIALAASAAAVWAGHRRAGAHDTSATDSPSPAPEGAAMSEAAT